MKVLFAVQDEHISMNIVKMYQKKYKEIISYKNIYYFTAILKELQRDKTYDRIVIDEELEEFNGTSFEQRDKFIFDKLDDISDEATNVNGKDIPIILICSDRRAKSEDIFVKLFGIGIYNAIIGEDRRIEEVCKLIYQPRLKKQAKIYYKIDSEEVTYKHESENDVSEEEMQNILMHFKKIGNNSQKCVESFRSLIKQYNKEQLKIIIKILPLNIKAVLEEQSPEYQKIVSRNSGISVPNTLKKEKDTGTVEKLLDVNKPKTKIDKPIVVPHTMQRGNVKKLAVKKQIEPIIPDIEEDDDEELEEILPIPEVTEPEVKPKKRGRPKKTSEQPSEQPIETIQEETKPKKRGRPRKNTVKNEETIEPTKQEIKEEKIIEPLNKKSSNNVVKKQQPVQEDIEEDDEFSVLPGFDEEYEDNDINQSFLGEDYDEDEQINQLPGFEDDYDDDYEEENSQMSTLPGLEDEEEDEDESLLPGFSAQDEYEDNEDEISSLPGFEEDEDEDDNQYQYQNQYKEKVAQKSRVIPKTASQSRKIDKIPSQKIDYDDSNFENLLSSDKKIAAFVGTSKNGTSFIVNNVAQYLSMSGVDTAILDTTQNKNSYYIYTKNEEELRNTASNCISNLIDGRADGITVNQNLTVYTSVPNSDEGIENVGPILETIIRNHSAVLIDCDFNTEFEYFEKAQEIYLVQSMDVLTIQPLTAFLRDLKAKDILEQNKIRIILNKEMNLRGITSKNIIGGMAFYNDPEMSFMTELFDRNTVRYIEVPFDEEAYAIYLEGVIECEISTNKYPKNFQQILKKLTSMVYPLLPNANINRPEKKKKGYQYSTGFSSSVNNTLNDMKRKY